MTAPDYGVVRWRKRPVVIEAVRWTGSNLAQVEAFTGPDRFRPVVPEWRDGRVKTAEVYDYLHDTWVGVYDGQQVIRGVKDELYPIDDSALAGSYDAVDGEADDGRSDGQVFYEAFREDQPDPFGISPAWGRISPEGRRQYEAGAAAVAARALSRKARP